MARHLLRHACFLLAAALAATLCTNAPASAAWQQSSFFIGGWYSGGTVDVPDTSSLIKLNNAGLDVVFGAEHWTIMGARAFVSQLDDLTARYSGRFMMKGVVKLQPSDTSDSKYSITHAMTPTANAAYIRQAVSPSFGLNTPSVMGYVVWDEPMGALIDSAAVVCNILATYDSSNTKLAYVNLYPPYVYGDSVYRYLYSPNTAYSSYNYRTAYEQYVRDYLNAFAPYTSTTAILSADNYELQNPNAPNYDFLFTWRTLRDLAGEYSRPSYRIPVSALIQLSADTRYQDYDTPVGQVRQHAYEALGYGAKSIQYWLDVPGGVYGDGILTSTGAQSSNYADIQTMNRDLHAVGNVLFTTDPVTVWMGDSLGEIGVAQDLWGAPEMVQNMVASVSSAQYSFSAHLKDRTTGDDYLLVINRNSVPASYTVTLTNTATTVYKLVKSSGAWTSSGSNTSSFSTGTIQPRDAQLFRIRDAIAEYIPNVNAMASTGSRMYFAHEHGLSMVDYWTGLRRNVRDGTLSTPVKDVALAGHSVYIAQSSLSQGNVIRWDQNLTHKPDGNLVWHRSGPLTAIDAGGGRVLIGATSSSVGWVIRSDTTLASADSVRIYVGVNDVKYQPGADAMIVAHQQGMQRRLAYGSMDSINTWQDGTATTPVARVFVDGTGVIAALDNGTNGNIQTVDESLWPNQSSWNDASSFPRVVDVVASEDEASILAAVPKSGGHKFSGISRSGMSQSWSVSASNPRAVGYLSSNQDAFLAVDAGVLRRSDGGTMLSRYDLPASDEIVPRPAFAFELRSSLIDASRGTAQLGIEAQFTGTANWSVFDIAGRVVRSGAFGPAQSARQQPLDLGAISTGAYFIRMEQAGVTATRRFVVLR